MCSALDSLGLPASQVAVKIEDGWEGLLASKRALPLDLGGGTPAGVHLLWGLWPLLWVAGATGAQGCPSLKTLVKTLLGAVLQD